MKRSAASAAVLDISTLEALHTLSHLREHFGSSLHSLRYSQTLTTEIPCCILNYSLGASSTCSTYASTSRRTGTLIYRMDHSSQLLPVSSQRFNV